ncbi:dephospho-CoA kinase [Bacteroidota bacterium]
MKVLGITGGIGSGKTTVCEVFQELGVPIYYADIRAKQLMTEDLSLRERIVEVFGKEAYTDGMLNRAFLAAKVFSSQEQLKVLNGLVHPAVAADFERWLEENEKAPYVIKEAAILFESGANRFVDVTVLVVAPEKIRINRVMLRDEVKAFQVKERMANQWSQERKEKLADYVINNDGAHLLVPQVIELHQKFVS